ncbi:MAG: type IV pilus modification protein PilV [Betaproteobacteria bacterium]|nr:type IV pilus modification protein PilV [Betaproteobacteria bacterium]
MIAEGGFSSVRKVGGFTLIEVLVTLVIVSVGLLGLIGLMLRGLQTSTDSVLRSIAIEQAYDMADRMRTNMAGVQAGNYDAVSGTTSCSTLNAAASSGTATVGAPSSAPTCSSFCASSSCSVANAMSYDACSWHAANYNVLPLGAGAVCKSSVAGANWFTIFVSWDETKSGATNRTFMLRFEP